MLGARPSPLLLGRASASAPFSMESPQQPGLTMEMALSISNATYMQLDKGLQGAHLEQIRTQRAGVSLSIRWQEMLNVYLSTLINNIVRTRTQPNPHHNLISTGSLRWSRTWRTRCRSRSGMSDPFWCLRSL